LNILDIIPSGISRQKERKGDEFIALRKGLGYCWSVAVVASPAYGKELLEKWIVSEDKDIRWIIKENIRKNRLIKCDLKGTKKMVQKLG
jgi:hypothetical protein